MAIGSLIGWLDSNDDDDLVVTIDNMMAVIVDIFVLFGRSICESIVISMTEQTSQSTRREERAEKTASR